MTKSNDDVSVNFLAISIGQQRVDRQRVDRQRVDKQPNQTPISKVQQTLQQNRNL